MDDQQPQIMSWIRSTFKDIGIDHYEESIADMGLEFLTIYLNDLISDITLFSEHFGRDQPTLDDIQMAIKMKQRTSSATSKEQFKDRVNNCNSTKLPREFYSTVELPKAKDDNFAFSERNYRIKTNEDFDDDDDDEEMSEDESKLADLPTLPPFGGF